LKIAAISSQKLAHNNEGETKNNYQYQGGYSEWDEDLGWNDFALRNYNPQIGRWVQQDPFQEFASPYIGMGSDPVNLVDPSGGNILSGTTAVGRAAVMTLGGAIIGMGVDLITGGDGGTGALIGASLGLGASTLNIATATSIAIKLASKGNAVINNTTITQAIGNQASSNVRGGPNAEGYSNNDDEPNQRSGWLNPDFAAYKWAEKYGEKSLGAEGDGFEFREYSSFIYEFEENGQKLYAFTPPKFLPMSDRDKAISSPFNRKEAENWVKSTGKKNGRLVAFIHSHPYLNDKSLIFSFPRPNRPMGNDEYQMRENIDLSFYLLVGNGELKYRRSENSKTLVIMKGLYRDKYVKWKEPKLSAPKATEFFNNH
jgi:RHS repeat-associated protein